jgi:hypothetical protein
MTEVDLDELDRLVALAAAEPSSKYAPNSYDLVIVAPSLSAELRQSRARVEALEAQLDMLVAKADAAWDAGFNFANGVEK